VDAYEGRGLAEVEADVAAEGARRGGGRPSLLQDVMRGRRTEIDYLNGYVCEQGRHRGVKTPVNDAIVETVRSYGVGQLKPDPKNLAPILKVLPKR
jgi:2-dehydropantoate 2-reductase